MQVINDYDLGLDSCESCGHTADAVEFTNYPIIDKLHGALPPIATLCENCAEGNGAYGEVVEIGGAE
tara:strand:- start:3488 stop:3688 length:201 start_codon:yes stop_codon:yes gene_type:complete